MTSISSVKAAIKDSALYEGAVVATEWAFVVATFMLGMIGHAITKSSVFCLKIASRVGKGESINVDSRNGYDVALLVVNLAKARWTVGVETPEGIVSETKDQVSDDTLRGKRVYGDDHSRVNSEEVAYIQEVCRESEKEQPGDIFGEKPTASSYQPDEPKEVPTT